MGNSYCELCGEKAVRETRPTEFTYKGHAITLDQPGTYCDSCGECLLESEDLKATRIDIADFHAKIDGVLGPSRIKKIRKVLKMTQRDLSILLGGGPNAFSRYEQGKVSAPRSISIALRLLEKHPDEVSEIQQPEEEAAPLRLKTA